MRLEINHDTKVHCYFWSDGKPRWAHVELSRSRYGCDGSPDTPDLFRIQTSDLSEIRTMGQMLVNFADQCQRESDRRDEEAKR